MPDSKNIATGIIILLLIALLMTAAFMFAEIGTIDPQILGGTLLFGGLLGAGAFIFHMKMTS
jgi:hypothetical protein